jgi:hypothetical protein
MGRFFLDCEFIEKPCSIELISIGLVSEDNRELYLESSDVDLSNVDPWLRDNVLPHLTGRGIPRTAIREAVESFIGSGDPEFWAYCASYDWVVFCWLFGRMVDLPKHYPHHIKDFRQLMDDYRIRYKSLPKKQGKEHHALADARWLRDCWQWFMCGEHNK